MNFFFRYLLVFVAGAAAWLGLAVYIAYDQGFTVLAWLAIAGFVIWLLAYVPFQLWRDYRRIRRIVEDLRAGRLKGNIDPDAVRDSVVTLVADYGGVPTLVAAWLAPRLLTDDIIRQLAGQADRLAGRR